MGLPLIKPHKEQTRGRRDRKSQLQEDWKWEDRGEGVLRSGREERRSFQKPSQKTLGTGTKHVSQCVLLTSSQNIRHCGSTKQESTLPEESFYRFLLCP